MGPGFRSLWATTASANLGDGMVVVLLPLLALSTGASPGGVAAVTTAATLAWPILGLHSGWVVDRADRRTLLTTVNAIRATAVAAVVVAAVSGTLSLPLVLAVALVYGIAETLIDTALTATIPYVVGPSDRGRANARIEGTINLTNQLAGPPAAGFLAGVAMTLATAVSGVLYLIAAALAATLRIRRHGPSTGPADPATVEPATVDNRVRAGLIFLWRHRTLRFLTMITAAMNVVWAVWTALFVLVAVDPGPLRLSAGQYGLVLTGMAVGGLGASMLVEPLRRRFGARAVLIADLVGTIALVAPIAVAAPAWITVIGVVIAGSGSSVWRIIVATIRQNVTPLDQLGRVYAAYRVLSWGVIPVSAALAGVAAELSSVRVVFSGATVLAVVVAVVFIVGSRRFDLNTTASRLQHAEL